MNISKSLKYINTSTEDMVQSSYQPPASSIETEAKVQFGTQQNKSCQNPHQINKCQRLLINHGLVYSTFEHTLGEPSIEFATEDGHGHLAAELYHKKSFAGKISLLISGWKVLISDHLVLETVIEYYPIPLTSTAG